MGTLMRNLLKKQALKKRLALIEKEIHLDQAKEVELLMQEGLSYMAALRKVKDMYEKAHNCTDQDSNYEHEKTFKNIIAENKDIDNGELYNTITGGKDGELL